MSEDEGPRVRSLSIIMLRISDYDFRRQLAASSRPVESRIQVEPASNLTMFGIGLPVCAQVYGADPSTGCRRLQLTRRRRVMAQIRATVRRYKTLKPAACLGHSIFFHILNRFSNPLSLFPLGSFRHTHSFALSRLSLY